MWEWGCRYFPLPLKYEAKNSGHCWEDLLGGFFQSGDEKNYKKPKMGLKHIPGTYQGEKSRNSLQIILWSWRNKLLGPGMHRRSTVRQSLQNCPGLQVLEPLFCPVFWIWCLNTLSLLFPVPAADRSCLAFVYLLHPDLCKTFISALWAARM